MEIRKADAKGRVTVGDPETHYRVIPLEGGSFRLAPLPKSDPFPLPVPLPQTGIDYLNAFGVNYQQVVATDWNDEGYYSMLVDAHGDFIRDATGMRAKMWCSWPEGFDAAEFIRVAKSGAGAI